MMMLIFMMMMTSMNIISPTDDSQAKAKVDGLESKGGEAAAVRLQTELNHLAYQYIDILLIYISHVLVPLYIVL